MSTFAWMFTLSFIAHYTSAANISCSTTYDHCGVIENSICSERKICECPVGFLLNSNNTRCSLYGTEYDSDCFDDANCKWLDNSKCIDGHCACKDDFLYYRGNCKKANGLGGSCDNETVCYDGYDMLSLKCENGKCVCNDDYYERPGIDCRKKSINGMCAIDLDCVNGDSNNKIYCIKGTCQTNTIVNTNNENRNTTTVTEDDDQTEEEETDLDKEKGFEEDDIECSENKDCEGENTECNLDIKKCVCKHGYFKNGESCVGELGVGKCSKDSDCPIRPAKCQDGICYCRDYWFQSKSNKNCIKSMTQTNFNCTSNEWCYAMGRYSYCDQDAKSCFCKNNYVFNKTNFICSVATCNSDKDCVDIKDNTHCENGSCQCNEHFQDSNGECIIELQAPCKQDTECQSIDNSFCNNGKCDCMEGYIQDGNITCIEGAEIGKPCKKDMQCISPNAVCDINEHICNCKSGYKINNQSCVLYKEYGEYCSNNLECEYSEQTTICIKNYCTCPEGMEFVNNKCNAGNVFESKSIVLLIAFACLIIKSN